MIKKGKGKLKNNNKMHKNFKLSSSNHQSMKVIDFGQGILEKNEDISSAIFQKL